MASIFSKIAAGEIPSYKIAEDDNYFAFLDINPMVKGHVLVIPKQEVDYVFDLDDNMLADMMIFAKKIAVALEKAISFHRVGVMLICLEVPHAHIHLIPINKESDMLLSNPKLKLEQQEFEEIAAEIRKQI